MTLPDINTKITNLTGIDTNTYANSDRLIDINLWLQKIVGMIFDSQDESDFDDQRASNYPIITTPLTTNRDYPIPFSEGLLEIKDLSVSYDGTNWYKANPFDIDQDDYPATPASATTAAAQTDSYFSRENPKYDYKYNSIWLYPMALSADVTNGGTMLIEFYRTPTDFTLANLTDATVIPGIDETFHAMLAYGPAYEYCQAKGFPQAERLYRELSVYENRLREQYSSKVKDRRWALKSNYQSMK